MASNEQRIESLYYELDMRVQGLAAGKARADAILKDLEIVAARSGKSIDEVAAAVNRSGASAGGLRKIADSFRATGDNAEHARLSLHAFMRPLESLATESLSANAQVGNLASKLATLGLGTGLTLGVLAAIAAIAKAWDFFTEGARKAKKATDDLIESLNKAADARADQTRSGLDAKVDQAIAASDDAQRKRDDLRERAAKGDLVARFQLKGAEEDLTKATRGQTEAQQALDDFDAEASKKFLERRKRESDAAKQLADQQRTAVNAFLSAIAAATPGTADDKALQLQARIQEAEKAGVPAAKIRELTKALKDAQDQANREDLAKQLRDTVSASTVSLVDNLTDSLNDLKKALTEKGATPELIKQIGDIQQAVIDATAATEQALSSAGVVNVDSPSNAIQKTRALLDIQDALEAAQSKVKAGTTAWEIYGKAIDAVKAKIAQLQNTVSGVTDPVDDITTKTAAIAGGIANAANAAFGLASAFLGVDSAITKALGSIGQMASGMSNVAKLAHDAGGFGKLFSTTSGLVSALPGIGQAIGGAIALASSLFGKSPEEQRRLQLQKENSDALRELSKRIGELGIVNVTGIQLQQLQKVFDSPLLSLRTLGSQSADYQNRIIGQALTAAGLSSKEFKDLMRSFGLAIDDAAKITLGDVNALKQAILDTQLGEFAHTFEGQMGQFQAAVKILDLQKPIDQFNALKRSISNISGGGGALEKLLNTFDLTTSAGIQSAITALESLFTQLQSLTPENAAAFLGGLQPQQVEQLIEQLIGIVRAQAGSGGVAGTGGFNISREITEQTGGRLEALLSTSNIFEEQIAQNTALIAQLLGGSPTLIQAPNISPSLTSIQGAASITFEGGITINIGAGADPATAMQTGAMVSDALVEAIDQKLALRFKRARLTRGIV